MENNINDFVEEITENFSELFVETFFIRYLNIYDKNELLETVKVLKNEINNKIYNKLIKKLKSMGYSNKDIKIN